MAKELLLAVDVGTQSTRALIFDLQGNLLFKAQIPLPTYQAPKPGWAELDPGIFWESLCQACQQLWATPGVDKGQIAGVAITTQRNVMINLDQQYIDSTLQHLLSFVEHCHALEVCEHRVEFC